MLIDGGGFTDSSFDMGKMVIAPFLYHERINTIDIVVLTHPHPDHLQGLLYIIDNFNVKEVWSTGQRTEDEIYLQWEKIIKQKNIKTIFLSRQSPSVEINGVHLNTLWPLNSLESHASITNYHQINDDSLVIKIKYGKTSFLLPADISSVVESSLIKSKQDLSSDVLFVPHHGSYHSSSSDFINKVSCRYAVISAGKENIFRHPHQRTLNRYKTFPVKILRTDKDGAITISTDGTKLHIDTYIKNR